jgi:hypothetical protein
MIFFPSLFPVRNSGPTEFSEAEATDVVEGVDALEQDVVVPLRAELEDGPAEKVELEKVSKVTETQWSFFFKNAKCQDVENTFDNKSNHFTFLP